MDPLSFWQKNDAEDRQGITENHHVTGYLAYWDELRRRHPEHADRLLRLGRPPQRPGDAAPGRAAAAQRLHHGAGRQPGPYLRPLVLGALPGTGTGSGALSPYLLRSTLVTHFTACFDVRRKDLDYDMIRRVLGQWRQYAAYYFGDYYPLTPTASIRRSGWPGSSTCRRKAKAGPGLPPRRERL